LSKKGDSLGKKKICPGPGETQVRTNGEQNTRRKKGKMEFRRAEKGTREARETVFGNANGEKKALFFQEKSGNWGEKVKRGRIFENGTKEKRNRVAPEPQGEIAGKKPANGDSCFPGRISLRKKTRGREEKAPGPREGGRGGGGGEGGSPRVRNSEGWAQSIRPWGRE